MPKLAVFLLGALSTIGVLLVEGVIICLTSRGFSVRERPSMPERWLASAARAMAIPGAAAGLVNPTANTPEVLAEARAHWADHCAGCHANDGSGETTLGRRTYPPAPDMRIAETQRLTDGDLFYIIQNGVRLTAMPGWGGDSAHGEQDSWKLVRFIRHLPQLSFEEKKEMEKLNPKSPEELREEEQEEEFLKGESGNESPHSHHHH